MKNIIEFKETLISELERIKIVLTDKQIDQLYKYKELLIEWNEKMNLTAITEDYEVIMKHFIDCLECNKALAKKESKIIDVGTGAGFPGMVLAIYYPEKEITLLDALNKRLIFLEEVVKKLGISNVKIIHGRAEEEGNKENNREKYDASVSRAVASLPVLLEYVSPYVKVNGKCIIMKGDSVEDEIILSKNALSTLNLKITNQYKYSYKVNNEEYSRVILEITKKNHTPNKYPRNYGLIKKKPL